MSVGLVSIADPPAIPLTPQLNTDAATPSPTERFKDRACRRIPVADMAHEATLRLCVSRADLAGAEAAALAASRAYWRPVRPARRPRASDGMRQSPRGDNAPPGRSWDHSAPPNA